MRGLISFIVFVIVMAEGGGFWSALLDALITCLFLTICLYAIGFALLALGAAGVGTYEFAKKSKLHVKKRLAALAE
jgi:hypothetical protein